MTELSDLRKKWRLEGKDWDLQRLTDSGDRAISLSDSQLAIDIFRDAVSRFEPNSDVRYLLALAYANTGSRDEVLRHIGLLTSSITDSDPRYVDCFALLGRVEKDRYIRHKGTPAGEQALINAIDAYNTAYEVSENSFPGINAATLFYCAGEKETAGLIATSLIEKNAGDQEGMWQLATLAEAHLLLEQHEQAIDGYRQVVEICGKDYGLWASVKKHMLLIAEHQKLPAALQDMLAEPMVVVFSGHLLDSEDREVPRFPVSIEDAVAAEIGKVIEAQNIKIGYCSAASGGDLLFAREMIKRELEVNIILPFDREIFRSTSVVHGGIDRSKEYRDVLATASSVTIATEESNLGNPCLFSYAADLIEGYASLRAQHLGCSVKMIAAIDPYTAGSTGGAVEVSQKWLDAGIDVTIVDIAAIRGEVAPGEVKVTAENLMDPRPLDREIKSVVEVVTNLEGQSQPLIEVLQARVPDQWQSMKGGGLNKAFHSIEDAADYAYRLRAESQMVSWEDHGLPASTRIQIAIHTGPVFVNTESEERDYFGSHVFHARDLAALTPAGCIYLTEQTAALLAIHGPDFFISDYLGTMEVKFKPRRVYRLHRP